MPREIRHRRNHGESRQRAGSALSSQAAVQRQYAVRRAHQNRRRLLWRGAAGWCDRKIVPSGGAGRRIVGDRLHAGSDAGGEHCAGRGTGGRADHHHEHGTHAIRSLGHTAYPRRYCDCAAAVGRRDNRRGTGQITPNEQARLLNLIGFKEPSLMRKICENPRLSTVGNQ